jgi:Clp amino terminal domain, pathogenicity island component
MFERMTVCAREAVLAAQEEARALGHPYVGTVHILLGVIRGQTDPLPDQASAFQGPARLLNPASYDVAQRTLIDAAGSLEAVRRAVLPVDISRLGVSDTVPIGPAVDPKAER